MSGVLINIFYLHKRCQELRGTHQAIKQLPTYKQISSTPMMKTFKFFFALDNVRLF